MPASGMLARLDHDTVHHHAAAGDDRLALLGAAPDRDRYAAFLARIHGFEAPFEVALVLTDGIEEWLDLRDRGHLKLLRADLKSLGIADPNQLPRCSTVVPFGHPADALGWLYAIERNTLLHGFVERHLRGRMPGTLRSAGSYLAGQQRSNGLRFRDLGAALDRMARDARCAERIVKAARAAFRAQHSWYDVAVPPRRHVDQEQQAHVDS